MNISEDQLGIQTLKTHPVSLLYMRILLKIKHTKKDHVHSLTLVFYILPYQVIRVLGGFNPASSIEIPLRYDMFET